MAVRTKRNTGKSENKGSKGPFYKEGLYFGTVTGQRFGMTGQKKTPYIAIAFKPTLRANPVTPNDKDTGEALETSYEREVTLYITEATIKNGMTVEQLRAVGWEGTRFSDLDPDSPNFQDLTGNEVKFYCKHETAKEGTHKGKTFDRWSVSTGTKGGSFDKPENQKGVAAKLDALFGADISAPPVSKSPSNTKTTNKASSKPAVASEQEDDQDIEEDVQDSVEGDVEAESDEDDLFGPEYPDEDYSDGFDDIPF